MADVYTAGAAVDPSVAGLPVNHGVNGLGSGATEQAPEGTDNGAANVVEDDSGTDTDDEGRLIQQANETLRQKTQLREFVPSGVPAKAGGKAAPKRPAGAITLRTLIESGLLEPGNKVLYVEYKGAVTYGDLTEDGLIYCQGQFYESPSAFSIYIKRQVNPDRKADDGWKAVKYEGRLLEHFKELYLRRQLAGMQYGLGSTPTASAATPSGMGGPGASSGPSPLSSTNPSPRRQAAEEAAGHASASTEDAPPAKRARLERQGSMGDNDGGPLERQGSFASQGPLSAHGKPALKIKLRLKGGSNLASPHDSASPTDGGSGVGPSGKPPLAPRQQAAVAAAAARPRRSMKAPSRFDGYVASGDEDDLDPDAAGAGPGSGVPASCARYAGEPGSGRPGAQPFHVLVADSVSMVIDFHSHCSVGQICGLLAGVFDQATRMLTVLRAYPVAEGVCRPGSCVTPDAHPQSHAQAQQLISATGLRCVGWYHSHPRLGSAPSTKDVDWQLLCQQRQCLPSGVQPCVAAVVSPHSEGGLGPRSSVVWYRAELQEALPPGACASATASPASGAVAVALVTQRYAPADGGMEIMGLLSTQLQALARHYAVQPSRAPLHTLWRNGVSQLDKLVASVTSWLPAAFAGELRSSYAQALRDAVVHEFGLPPAAAATLEDQEEAEGANDGVGSDDGRSELSASGSEGGDGDGGQDAEDEDEGP